MLGRGNTNIVPTFIFLPFGERTKMQVVKTCGGFCADLAAADGGEELAVKGNRHLFEFERESGNGGSKVARRIAVGGIVRPLRAGQDNGLSKPCSERAKRLAVYAMVSVPCNTKMPS